MAYEIDVFDHSLEASVDLSASQHLFVNIDSNGKWALSGAGEAGYSLQDKPEAGQFGEARMLGIAKVVAGAAVAAGAFVTSDASSKAVPATTGDVINGHALTAASAADEVITILVPGLGAVAA